MAKSSSDTKELVELKLPDMYRVIIHNDNSTPYDLVIFILLECVEIDEQTAIAKTHEAHVSGSAVVGTFTKTKAEEIVELSKATATANGFPEFTLTMEKD